MTSSKQLPARHALECIAGNPFTFTVTTTGATITSPAVTIKDASRTTVTADPSVPTVSQVSTVTTVAFSAADTAALGGSLKKNYTYSLQALVNGAGPYELVADVFSVSPVGTAGASSTSSAALTVTVGAAALSLTVSLGGDIQAHLDDTTDAHDASAISFAPAGTIAATDVQTAVAEVATEAASALSTHAAVASSVHGISAFGATLVDDADASTARSTLGLVIGTNVQAYDADLASIAAANNGAVLAATTATFTTADETKLDGIESGATADQTAAEILAALLTVDGAGSGLDADLLDGQSSAAFAAASEPIAAAHIADMTDAHDASAISVLDTAGRWTATDVEGVLAEVPLRHGSFVLATDPRFGATGDGTTDDTAALQAFIDHVVTNHLHGFIPAGTYKITDTLDVPERESWIIEGASRHFTIIKQHTNNIPAIAMGSVAGSGGMHSWELKSFSIDYNAAQTGNTAADCILFSAMGYLGTIDNISFRGGYNGIKVASGIVGFWGCNIDRLWFQQGLRGSCIDMSAGSSAGVPNNRFGSLYTDATNAATAAVLFDIKGTGYTIGQIEANSVNNGNQVLRVYSDTRVTIGSVLIENGAWATGANICEFTGASFFDIGSVWVSGADCAPASGQLALIKMGTGCVGRIGRLQADADTLTGECNLIEAGTAQHIIVDDVIMSGGWTLSIVPR